MHKYDLVKHILQHNNNLFMWYKDNHNVTIDMLNHSNVSYYGGGNYGEIADLIIEDGLKLNIIREDEHGEYIIEPQNI